MAQAGRPTRIQISSDGVNFRDITDDIVDIDYSFVVSPEVAITGYDMAQINARDVTVDVQIDGSRLRALADGLRESGVAAGAAASALGNVGREAIQTAQRFERDMARLEDILQGYGCNRVQFTNDNNGGGLFIDVRFGNYNIRDCISRQLIERSNDWVSSAAQYLTDYIQRHRRQEAEAEIDVPEMASLNEYFDSLRGWAVSYSVGYEPAFRTDTQNSLITLEVTFQEGDVEQRIVDTGRYRNEVHEYLNRLYRELHRAHQLLIGDERGWHQRQDFESIVSVTPARHASRGIIYDDLMATRDIMMGRSQRSFTDEENNRARDLLVSCLNNEQREVFERYNFFDITGQSGEKYRIKHGKAYNVTRLSDKVELCAGPADNVPTYDYMLAQKIWLEADEAGFLGDANERRGFFGGMVFYWDEPR